MYLVTAKEMQQMDQATIQEIGIPGRILMENAGAGAFRFMCRVFPDLLDSKVAVIAGRGNNGGDGFVIARHLFQKDIAVKVFLLSAVDKVQGDARANLDLLFALGIPVIEVPDENSLRKQKAALRKYDLYVDAILGTGLKSDVRGHYRKVISFLNALDQPVFSVDIPSGLNADNGQICGNSIEATATATFAFPKIGHAVYPGAELTGALDIVEIGVPKKVVHQVQPRQFLLQKEMVASMLRKRDPNTHKGQTGHILVVAGAPGKTGAAAMAATTAMRVGAGLVTLGVPEGLHAVIEPQVTEVMTYALPQTTDGMLDELGLDAVLKLATDKRCLVMGPGIGTAEETKALMWGLILANKLPLVIDADGLNILSEQINTLKPRRYPLILTPHPGEMGRLCGLSAADIQKNRIDHARSLATQLGAHVVLKGARTVMAHPDGSVFINPSGNSGMASGGMGDVLTGAIAGYIAQGYDPKNAIHLGVYLHGAAADHLCQHKGPFGYLATEVMNQLPEQIRNLLP
jgi:NAD(P)H-hydrate epimerase